MILDETLFEELIAEANEADRKRSHRNLHRSYDEPVQRLCIGLVKGTYIRPHYHERIGKGELIMGLSGATGLTTFDGEGRILEKRILGPDSLASGVELGPDVWHTLYPLSDAAVIMEVKAGPYTPTQEGDFASWAPKEGDESVPRFLDWIETASIGERFRD